MNALQVTLTTAYDGSPLAVVDGLPGSPGTELRLAQARALAHALLRLADDAEKRKAKHRGRLLRPERRVFPVEN